VISWFIALWCFSRLLPGRSIYAHATRSNSPLPMCYWRHVSSAMISPLLPISVLKCAWCYVTNFGLVPRRDTRPSLLSALFAVNSHLILPLMLHFFDETPAWGRGFSPRSSYFTERFRDAMLRCRDEIEDIIGRLHFTRCWDYLISMRRPDDDIRRLSAQPKVPLGARSFQRQRRRLPPQHIELISMNYDETNLPAALAGPSPSLFRWPSDGAKELRLYLISYYI